MKILSVSLSLSSFADLQISATRSVEEASGNVLLNYCLLAEGHQCDDEDHCRQTVRDRVR